MYECSALIGSSTIIRHVQHLVLKVSETDFPLLITGELGTNKESVALFIKQRSQRSSGPFVVLRPMGRKIEDIEKELFVGTPQAPALLQMAHNGILYIDEVTALPFSIQEKLFRFLNEPMQEGLNVRVICSSSTNVEQHIRGGVFKQELFYKLSASSIFIPPLRERREDVATVIEFFVKRFNESKNKKISGVAHDALNALLQYSWPNNVQELENLIERIVVLKSTGSIQLSDLPPKIRRFVTDNIDEYFSQDTVEPTFQKENESGDEYFYSSPASKFDTFADFQPPSQPKSPQFSYRTPQDYPYSKGSFEEGPSDIDQFIKKEIDLGSGVDFYKVVEEFENRLISEALRRTNHNKNRAAQLLSMNRTTLVEKLKKRAASHHAKPNEINRVKKNAGFTIFDGLGNKARPYEGVEFITFKSRSDFEEK